MKKTEEISEQDLKLLKAISNKVRLKIIKLLLEKEFDCVCNLSAKIKKDPSVVFRHITILKDAGIVTTEKRNRFLFCRIKDKNTLLKIFEFVKKHKK
jgi:DNA-binding transcriptional ArsR family regulator